MSWDNIIGNTEAKKYLLNSVLENRMSQSYIFIGTEGIGKLLIAKQFAKKILCLEEKKDDCNCKSCQSFDNLNNPDYCIINESGTTIKIEQVREITNKIIEQPIVSNKKVYIINDCEKMSVEAQNCLLKTLEEPPEFAIIILIVSNENAILNTIKSRCMKINFKNISNCELKKYAIDKLGYTQMTDNFLKVFNGSIGKAIIQKENQEKYLEIESLINNLDQKDLIDILNDSKIIYEKEKIYIILEFMAICVYEKRLQNIKYINCVEKINNCLQRLKSNCNFDMCLDTMLFEIWEELN